MTFLSRLFSGEGTQQDFRNLQNLSTFLTGFSGATGQAAQRGFGTLAGIGVGAQAGQSFLQNALAQQQRRQLIDLQTKLLKAQLETRKKAADAQTKVAQILGEPGALDAEGFPTPATIGKLRAVGLPQDIINPILNRASRSRLTRQQTEAAERRTRISAGATIRSAQIARQSRLEAAAIRAAATRATRVAADTKSKRAGEDSLRDDFVKLSQDFTKVRDAIGRVRASQPTGAGDVSLIFNFMKMLDPTSVVREGEFATAENTAGVPERLRIQYNKLLRGERLGPEQRAAIRSQAEDLFNVQARQQQKRVTTFKGIAKRRGFNPKNVTIDLTAPKGATVKEGTTATNPKTGQKIIFKNGRWVDAATGKAIQ